MPWGLKRFQQAGDLHFIIFSCYRRKVKLGTGAQREVVERALEQVRRQYGFFVTGYVVMPEYVHLLVKLGKVGLAGFRKIRADERRWVLILGI